MYASTMVQHDENVNAVMVYCTEHIEAGYTHTLIVVYFSAKFNTIQISLLMHNVQYCWNISINITCAMGILAYGSRRLSKLNFVLLFVLFYYISHYTVINEIEAPGWWQL